MPFRQDRKKDLEYIKYVAEVDQLTNSNAKSRTGWHKQHSIHCSNSALRHFVKRGMGEDSIKYSWETNFLNEAHDCCSFQLASYKYCLEDFVGKYCCWYLYFQYSKMFFD